ncbi:MAG: hypothetical protein ACTSPL_08510 [Candidatus Odinarchaeia archaeon]
MGLQLFKPNDAAEILLECADELGDLCGPNEAKQKINKKISEIKEKQRKNKMKTHKNQNEILRAFEHLSQYLGDEEATKLKILLEKFDNVTNERLNAVYMRIKDVNWIKVRALTFKDAYEIYKLMIKPCADTMNNLLSLLEEIGLTEPADSLDAIEVLDKIVELDLIHNHTIRNILEDRYDQRQDFFKVFLYLLVYLKKRLDLGETTKLLNIFWERRYGERINLENLNRDGIFELIKILTVACTLRTSNLSYLALKLAIENLNGYRIKITPRELALALKSLEQYAEAEMLEKMLIYAYFFSDAEFIIKISELAKYYGTFNKAITALKDLYKSGI